MYEETTNFYGDDRKQNYLPPPRSCPFVVSRVFSSARQVSSSWFISIRSHSLSAAWLGRFVTSMIGQQGGYGGSSSQYGPYGSGSNQHSGLSTRLGGGYGLSQDRQEQPVESTPLVSPLKVRSRIHLYCALLFLFLRWSKLLTWSQITAILCTRKSSNFRPHFNFRPP